jgi:hypothetical protein
MENGNNLIHSFNNDEYSEGNFKGLTKREYFAGLAMQGMVTQAQSWNYQLDLIANAAVKMADALLKELEKQQQNETDKNYPI